VTLHYFCVRVHMFVGLFINYCMNMCPYTGLQKYVSLRLEILLLCVYIQLTSSSEATRVCIICTPASENKHLEILRNNN
jgi:hypothetical protein